jgi:hypothetical protein
VKIKPAKRYLLRKASLIKYGSLLIPPATPWKRKWLKSLPELGSQVCAPTLHFSLNLKATICTTFNNLKETKMENI